MPTTQLPIKVRWKYKKWHLICFLNPSQAAEVQMHIYDVLSECHKLLSTFVLRGLHHVMPCLHLLIASAEPRFVFCYRRWLELFQPLVTLTMDLFVINSWTPAMGILIIQIICSHQSASTPSYILVGYISISPSSYFITVVSNIPVREKMCRFLPLWDFLILPWGFCRHLHWFLQPPHLFAVSLHLIVEFSQVLVLMGLNEDGLIEFSVRWRCQQTLINQLIKWNVKLWIQNTLFKKITTEADDVKILKAHHL